MAAAASENGVCDATASVLRRATGKALVVLGAQWGDEGKGKVVDQLAGAVDVVARCQGGNNAGHTVVANGRKYDFHLLPSGVIQPRCSAVIGNGVVVHLPALFDEVHKNGIDQMSDWPRRLVLSSQAHLVFDLYQQVDGLQEQARDADPLGTTRKGIGPAYSMKALRSGLRVQDLVGDFGKFEARFRQLHRDCQLQHERIDVDVEQQVDKYRQFAVRLRQLGIVADTVAYVNDALGANKRVLVEGANGALLDLDHGTYPFVTSSNASVGGVCTGLGISPHRVGPIIGVVKAYQTRVGKGPFPTEQEAGVQGAAADVGERLRQLGAEFGTTTGRPRRCGWLDLVALRRSTLICGFTELALTKLDVLDSFAELRVGVAYELDGRELSAPPTDAADMGRVRVRYETLTGWQAPTVGARRYDELPAAARAYVEYIERAVDVPVRWIGVGQDRDALVTRHV